jgi:hypothetical protein
MPPEGYTTVTISNDTAAKLAELGAAHELESVAEAVEYAVDVAQEPETLSDAELARLLYQRLTDNAELQ